jgi:carbonic anhydrase
MMSIDPLPHHAFGLAIAALLSAVPAMASDARPPAKSESAARAAPGHAAGTVGDPAVPATRKGVDKPGAPAPDAMEALRAKLSQRLGASRAPDAPSPNVVRVVSRSGDAAPADGHATTLRVKPAAARPSPAHSAGHSPAHTAGLVAKLRAEKAAAGHQAGAHLAHWGYGEAGGPAQWGSLKPEFAKCANGSRQSPIDIRGGVKVDLEPIQFDYRAGGFSVVDNGHTVQVNLAAGNSIEVMGRRYELLQFHFHRPSEERIDGRSFDMSVHLVHRDPEGRLAVVGVLLDRGSAHPVVQAVWNNLPLEKGELLAAQVAMDPSHLLPADRRYYTYMGSLTTPPCSEGVLWMVMQQPVQVTPEQVAVFARLYPMNARPVQSAAGRMIKGSN